MTRITFQDSSGRASFDRLEVYRRRRDFERTSEPAGGAEPIGNAPIFVVQKHAASRLHYDFRLEVGGTLRSWAVPRGPSLDPREKRLAAPTEDHPLEYGGFEGSIPKGSYGAGTVLVWDLGTYTNLSQKRGQPLSMEEALEKGHAVFRLEGAKLRGDFALTRFKTGRDESWLLVKVKDAHADPDNDITATRPESVLSGRTLEEIAAGR